MKIKLKIWIHCNLKNIIVIKKRLRLFCEEQTELFDRKSNLNFCCICLIFFCNSFLHCLIDTNINPAVITNCSNDHFV